MHMISGNRHRGSRFLFLKRAEVLSENCGWSRKKEKNCGKILLKCISFKIKCDKRY